MSNGQVAEIMALPFVFRAFFEMANECAEDSCAMTSSCHGPARVEGHIASFTQVF